ncbi:Lrp/AsnC family transcriptional regulator [Acetobacter sp. TBRC 12305]|uniref:Lrp/AsnC family transcriptional regulator n=1 Tax=Acetobacter garciniae TaxID=2817435 RepID=A0A939HRS7_9PROT|nr:Lrp/AsnC family transcriptional regulator [Acetobacter garciniae]MBO1326761.1 Lrp/AsnC family transcriptional regulator [Acetobacter garciniae]MBX0345941.1 Lrp/AsnC family transcriptional regulator [Acetobacter garciniae]
MRQRPDGRPQNGRSTRTKRHLDQFDRAILRILQNDSRTSQRMIAESVHLSPAAVQRRISAMENSGIIEANVAIVAPDAVQSSITIIVEVHLQNDRAATIEPMKALFNATPEVQQCYYVTGNGGFFLVMLVPDMKRYEHLSRTLFSENSFVDTFRTLVVLDRVKTGLGIVIPDF